MQCEFVWSQKGKPLLTSHGFLFSKCSVSKYKVAWRCVNYVKDCCRGRAHTSSDEPGGIILWESAPDVHNHAPRQEVVEGKRIIGKMKDSARRCNDATSSIVTAAVASASSVVAAELPGQENLLRTVQRCRQVGNPQLLDPSHREHLVLPDIFQKTLKGEQFLLYDSGGKKRILIFSTHTNLTVLASCDIWCSDGTFKSVPKIYGQLYTIHGYKNGKLLPLVFALLPDKKVTTYTQTLKAIQSAEPSVKPKHMSIDFEMSFMSSCYKCFPDIVLDGCLFNFSQCVWRYVQKCKLSIRYGEDMKFALRVRMLIALAFIPTYDVITAFETLVKSKFFATDDDIDTIIGYFESTWTGAVDRRGRRGNPLFPITMWNCYDAVLNASPRTNNSVEGWHHRFNRRVRVAHACIGKFINALKEEQGVTEMCMAQINAGRNVASRKRKRYLEYDKRLCVVVNDYVNRSILKYLKSIALNIVL